MPQIFKRIEEKKPFTYPTIVEVRKGNINYSMWIIGIALLIIVTGLAFIIFR